MLPCSSWMFFLSLLRLPQLLIFVSVWKFLWTLLGLSSPFLSSVWAAPGLIGHFTSSTVFSLESLEFPPLCLDYPSVFVSFQLWSLILLVHFCFQVPDLIVPTSLSIWDLKNICQTFMVSRNFEGLSCLILAKFDILFPLCPACTVCTAYCQQSMQGLFLPNG